MTRAALIPKTVWLSGRALDALDEFRLTSGREYAAWLFGHRFDDEVEIHRIDGWVAGDRDSVAISRDTQLSSDVTKTTACNWSATCIPTPATSTGVPRTNTAGHALRVSLAGRSSA